MVLLTGAPAPAQNLPTRFITADGTWDCKDGSDAGVGAIAVAYKTYAFILQDRKVAGYGTLRRIAEDTDTPKFLVVDGYLRDEIGAAGVGVTGPRENSEEFSGDLYLYVVVSADRDQNWSCAQRKAPGSSCRGPGLCRERLIGPLRDRL